MYRFTYWIYLNPHLFREAEKKSFFFISVAGPQKRTFFLSIFHSLSLYYEQLSMFASIHPISNSQILASLHYLNKPFNNLNYVPSLHVSQAHRSYGQYAETICPCFTPIQPIPYILSPKSLTTFHCFIFSFVLVLFLFNPSTPSFSWDFGNYLLLE